MTALAHVGPVPLEETVAAIAPVIAVTGRGYLAALRTRMRSATKDSIGAALEHTRRAAGDCDVRIAAPGATDLHDAVAR